MELSKGDEDILDLPPKTLLSGYCGKGTEPEMDSSDINFFPEFCDEFATARSSLVLPSAAANATSSGSRDGMLAAREKRAGHFLNFVSRNCVYM